MTLHIEKIIKQRNIRDKRLIVYSPMKYLVQIFILDKNGDILKSKCFFYGEKTKTKLMKLVNQEYNKYKNLLYHTDNITLDDYDILNLDK